jgi:hypothetical protein
MVLCQYYRQMTDQWSSRIAAFVVQALELELDPADLIPEIVALKRDDDTGTSAVELQSSIGPTPFLVYHYTMSHAGKRRLEADIATLEKAATLDTPGPRIVAHATTDEDAFILATTPGVHSALTGTERAAPKRPPMPLDRARTRVPDRLVEKLREANRLAGDWLGAIKLAGEDGAELELTDQEAALALYLLDETSIRDLLQTLNLLLATVRSNAAGFDHG